MFQFECGQNLPFDWPASVSNILTVRWWAEPNIVGRNFTSRIHPMSPTTLRNFNIHAYSNFNIHDSDSYWLSVL